ncbi:glucuronate isomerase [Sphingobacterium spiritivorum]
MQTEQFLNDNFLLSTPLAQQLYHDYAASLPVIDYHSHLPPLDIRENKNYKNITDIWLAGDHYKWRAMRAFGVEEKYITGDASDRDKFQKWAETVPFTIRNPLFHWTHMELKNPFGFSGLLNGQNAQDVFDKTEQQLQTSAFSTQGLLQHFNVEMVGTTDDPADDLADHSAIAQSDFKTKILPSFRPDKSLHLDGGDDYRTYLTRLSAVANVQIVDLDSLIAALHIRIEFFHALGCRISDHGLSCFPLKGNSDTEKINHIFKAVLDGDDTGVTVEIKDSFSFYILAAVSRKYHEKGWAQQYHVGALRNNNQRQRLLLGPDTGFDSIGDYQHAAALSAFLNHLDRTDQLAKTIIYNLNPADNAVFASMAGNFQGEGIKSKIQFGSAWWFLDQLDGMKKQMDALSNMGLISCFIGMLTDSRSFLSYSRHEYFRRLLCNIFAEDIHKGLIPNDPEWIGKIISDICYFNAKEYFGF